MLFTRETTLMGLPFDLDQARPVGPAVPLVQDVVRAGTTGFDAFSASGNGILLYRSGGGIENRILVWLDRSGNQIEAKGEAQPYDSVGLSPDEKRAAVSILPSVTSADVWLQDLVSGTSTKFTFGTGRRLSPVWSPDESCLRPRKMTRQTTDSHSPIPLFLTPHSH